MRFDPSWMRPPAMAAWIIWRLMRTRLASTYTRHLPDPDLVIRTSGEMRLSNFLLWNWPTPKIYVTPTLWPESAACIYWKA